MRGYAWYACLAILIVSICILFWHIKKQSLVSIKYDDVKVMVVDVEYRPSYITMTRIGNSTVPITHSPTYKTTVLYDGYKFDIYDEDIYDKYKDRIGVYTDARLETQIYKNNKIKYEIVRIY